MGSANFLLAYHHHHRHTTTHHSSVNSGLRTSQQIMWTNVATMNRRRAHHPSDTTTYTQNQPLAGVNTRNFKDAMFDACLIFIVLLLVFMIGYTIYHWVKKD